MKNWELNLEMQKIFSCSDFLSRISDWDENQQNGGNMKKEV